MNDLNYPFLTKREANQYRKEIEQKTKKKYITKKIVFTSCVYKIFPEKNTGANLKIKRPNE